MNDSKREKILEVADLLFKRHGLKKTTIDEIAKDAGIGKGTIYNYFNSKEEIFLAAQRAMNQSMLQKLRSVVRKENSPSQQLVKFMHARMQLTVELFKQWPFSAEILVESHMQPEYQVAREEYFREEEVLIRSILEDGVEKREFSIKNFDKATWVVGTALRGLTVSLMMGEQNLPTDSIEYLTNILLHGIATT